MGKLRLHCPALPIIAVRKSSNSIKYPAQYDEHSRSQVDSGLRTWLKTHAERTGLVIRHQQLTPLVSCVKTSLYCGYAESPLPDVELHVDMPDMVPCPTVTDHVLVKWFEVGLVPATDGSKIMAVRFRFTIARQAAFALLCRKLLMHCGG